MSKHSHVVTDFDLSTQCPLCSVAPRISKKSVPLAMKMHLAEEQLVRGQRQQDVHKTPDKKQAPRNRGLSLGKLGLASSGAYSICFVCHHQPQPPVTKCPHLLVCLRARVSPAVYFLSRVSPLVISFLLSLLLLLVHLIIHLTNIPLAL